MADDTTENQLKVGSKLKLNYIKAPDYRTLYCDGAMGSVTPRGMFAMSVYNERAIIPRVASREVLELSAEKGVRVGKEEVEESKDGFCRQVEATLIMDYNAVRELYVWLGSKVGEMEQALKIPEQDRLGVAERKKNE